MPLALVLGCTNESPPSSGADDTGTGTSGIDLTQGENSGPRLDMGMTVPMDARAWRFDLVLRGRRQTLFENRPEGA